ncbi:MAG: ABC transporter substrate-binding protein [Candidatus Binatia bacterium]
MRIKTYLKESGMRMLTFLAAVSLALSPVKAGAADEIKLGNISVTAQGWALYAAEQKGYFKEENLKVRKFIVRSVSKAMQALSANSTNILFPGSTSGMIRARVKKAPVTIIGGGFSKALYDLIAGAKYKKVEDLRGTTTGVINLTSGSTILLKTVLAAHGLHYPKDFDMLVVGGTPDRFAAVKSGGVSAAMVTPPTSFKALEAGLNVLANIGNYLPDYQFNMIGANSDWLKGNRDVAVRFLKCMIKAQRFLNDPKNKEEAIDILEKGNKIKRKFAQMSYKMIMEDLKPMPTDASVSTKAMDVLIKVLVENKKLKKSYPASTFIDDSYRKEALKRLGG